VDWARPQPAHKPLVEEQIDVGLASQLNKGGRQRPASNVEIRRRRRLSAGPCDQETGRRQNGWEIVSQPQPPDGAPTKAELISRKLRAANG